ncbi:MAG: acyl-CoA dehydrogenase [Deltaproteobacteria bacterium]|nr:MAG: acyl-CoA dehydrogenase [Deltaproteobacteria bacterium]
MDLTYTESEQAFREECRAWLEAHVPRTPLASHNTREGFAQHVAWEHELFDAGWAVVSWPKRFGGREATLIEWLIFEEEYYRAGAPARVTQNGIFLLGPTLFECGSEEQLERILRPMARADFLWAQAWSEPNSGSDLASVRSTARRVEGGWRLSGNKTWCSRGSFSDGIYGLFRTDPDSQRHRGLTYFMIHLDQPGITLRGVDDLDGEEAFAEVFLDDVFVPDADVIGEVNQGWRVAMATTSSERGLSLRSPGRFQATADRLLTLYAERGRPERLRDRVLQSWMDAEAYSLYTYQTVTRMREGGHIGADSSLNKIFWSEMDIATHETAMALLGESAWLAPDAPDATEGWLHDFLFSLAGPIYAGTNEIQRNIVAQRVLELPR